jgi:uncharacterized protein YjbI with pentapeptide repeats
MVPREEIDRLTGAVQKADRLAAEGHPVDGCTALNVICSQAAGAMHREPWWEDLYDQWQQALDDYCERQLQGADLEGADLAGMDLSGASLDGANLRGANLERATLNHGDLSRADLRHANLGHASLVFVGFSQSDLSGANLAHADLKHAHLHEARLNDADLTGAILRGADLEEADLSGAQMQKASLIGADLTGANLTTALLAGSVFDWKTRCSKGTDLGALGALRVGPGVNLAGADLSGVHLWDANLTRMLVRGSEERGAGSSTAV